MESASSMPTPAQGAQVAYSPPAITDHGSIADVTRAHAAGPHTDAAFPANTPLTSITFSGT